MDIDQEILTLTQKLITFRTTSHNKEEISRALDFIEHYLQSAHLFFKRHQKNGIQSLIISNREIHKDFDIILHGHIDVVPAGKQEIFVPWIEEGKLYGRGALDMKGGLAVLIVLMKYLKTPQHIGLFITGDEELGGVNGTAHLLKDENYKAKFFLTGEGVRDNFPIYNKAKGAVSLKVKSTGITQHASRPWLGESAIENYMRFYNDIQNLFPIKNAEDNWYSTCLLTTLHAGQAINSIPEYAEGTIDIRFTEDWSSADSIINDLQTIAKKHLRTSYEVTVKNEMLNTPSTNPYVEKLVQATQVTLPAWKLSFMNAHGASDARYAAEAGIPAIEFGPIGLNSHAEGEYVEIKSLFIFYEILKKFVLLD